MWIATGMRGKAVCRSDEATTLAVGVSHPASCRFLTGRYKFDQWVNQLLGDSKSTALRNASLSVLAERRENHESTHPLFWGGFILVGDPN
jgi:hypothetical protein